MNILFHYLLQCFSFLPFCKGKIETWVFSLLRGPRERFSRPNCNLYLNLSSLAAEEGRQILFYYMPKFSYIFHTRIDVKNTKSVNYASWTFLFSNQDFLKQHLEYMHTGAVLLPCTYFIFHVNISFPFKILHYFMLCMYVI